MESIQAEIAEAQEIHHRVVARFGGRLDESPYDRPRVAAFQFGFSQGNIVAGVGLPVGKALTGLTAGYVFNWLRETRYSNVISAVISYIPEGILTYVLFKYLLPVTTGIPVGIAVAISIQIIAKALIEMVILGVMLTGLTGNAGFRGFTEGYFRKDQ